MKNISGRAFTCGCVMLIILSVFQTGCTREQSLNRQAITANIDVWLTSLPDTGNSGSVVTPPTGPYTAGQWRPNARYHQIPVMTKPEVLWQGPPLVHPRGLMTDPDNSTVWVSDPGDSRSAVTQPSRIIRFPIINNRPSTPEIFFERKGYLISAKWAVPIELNGKKLLVIADQGEERADGSYTGKGAKVFTIPVLPDHTAGEPTLLWEGLPFVCPTGVVLVDGFLYITDPCAGPWKVDPENPSYSFPTSSIFAMATEGNKKPVELLSGSPFVSLIGICPLVPGELIFNDTDSGKRFGKTLARAGFGPQATADRWIVKILDPRKPTLSVPQRTPFTEQGDLRVNFGGIDEALLSGMLKLTDRIMIYASNGTRIITADGPVDSLAIVVSSLNVLDTKTRSIDLVVASDVMADDISLDVDIPGLPTLDTQPLAFNSSLAKDENRGRVLMDNKHGGARSRQSKISGTVYDRFTLDNGPGHGSVWIYPDAGGTPKALAAGSPLSRPLAGQLSLNQQEMWLTDQDNAALYVLPFPSGDMFDNLYGVQVGVR